jgi:ferredoxin
MSTTIFCFSATGNSLYAARELASQLGEASVVPINHLTLRQTHVIPERVGFVCPVYFWGIPNLVRDFIRTLSITPATDCFSVATKGGSEYIAHRQIDELLKERGARLSYAATLLLPGNYQIMYPAPSKEKQEKMFTETRQALGVVAGEISRLTKKPPQSHPWLPSALAGWVWRTMYSKPGGRDKNFHATGACIHCGLCAKVCPVANIAISNGVPQWRGSCQGCLACLHWCPKEAVQYKKSTQRKGRYHHPEITANDIAPEKSL